MSSEAAGDEDDLTREELAERIQALEARTDRQADRLDELDAAIQAVRGFLGGVDAVNEAVERRADAAVAAVERLEARLGVDTDELEDVSECARDVTRDGGLDETVGDALAVGDDPTEDNPTEDGCRGTSLRDRLRALR